MKWALLFVQSLKMKNTDMMLLTLCSTTTSEIDPRK